MEQDENGNVIVARILAGSIIHKQGVLHCGDVILDVNGRRVVTPEDLTDEVVQSKSSIQFRIAPGTDTDIPLKTNQVI